MAITEFSTAPITPGPLRLPITSRPKCSLLVLTLGARRALLLEARANLGPRRR